MKETLILGDRPTIQGVSSASSQPAQSTHVDGSYDLAARLVRPPGCKAEFGPGWTGVGRKIVYRIKFQSDVIDAMRVYVGRAAGEP